MDQGGKAVNAWHDTDDAIAELEYGDVEQLEDDDVDDTRLTTAK